MRPARRGGSGRAAVLALIAGYVDSYAFLNYKVYASFMSGNTTQTGMQTGQQKFAEAGLDLLPIPLFVAGVFAGAFLVHSSLRHRLSWLFGLVAALLAVAMAAVYPGPLPGWFGIMILSLAMGIMNTTVNRVGEQSVSLEGAAPAFAIGVGAFGDSFEDCRPRFGELISVSGGTAYQPADGTNVADYLPVHNIAAWTGGSGFGGPAAPADLAHAGFVLVGYTLVLSALAFWIFHRRDVQGATGGG